MRMTLHQDFFVEKEEGKNWTPDQVQHAILLDLRDHLKYIRRVARFFYVMGIIYAVLTVVGLFIALARL